MKNFKRIAVTFLAAILAIGLVACKTSQEPESSPAADAPPAETSQAAEETSSKAAEENDSAAEDTYTIGVVLINLEHPFHLGEQAGAMEYGRRNGVEVIVMSGEDDAVKQVEAYETLVAKGVDAIAINTIDATAFAPSIEAAKEKGIPTIILHSDDENAAMSFKFDEIAGSSAVGEDGVRLLTEKNGAPEGKVGIMLGMLGQGLNETRGGGFKSVMESNEGIEIVAEEATDWENTKAVALMENWLTAYPDLDMIYCLSEGLSIAASDVITNAGLRDQIIICGYDGMPYGIEAVIDGTIDNTLMLCPEYTGYLYVKFALEAAQGKELPAEYLHEGVVVTKENAEACLALGNDIAQNVETFQFDKPLKDLVAQYE